MYAQTNHRCSKLENWPSKPVRPELRAGHARCDVASRRLQSELSILTDVPVGPCSYIVENEVPRCKFMWDRDLHDLGSIRRHRLRAGPRPRAYLITPIHSNAVTLTYSFLDGGITFDGTVPITGATATFNLSTFSYSHSLNFFGRTANFVVSLPYGVGNFRGQVVGAEVLTYRSGLLPATLRFSVNLKGGPAMNAEEFSGLVNLGTNRWALKPELSYSRRWGHWLLEGYGGAWFYTTNPQFFSHNQFSPGTNTQSQSPIGPLKGTSATTLSLGCGYHSMRTIGSEAARA